MKRFIPVLLAGLVALPGIAGDHEVSLLYSSASGRTGTVNSGSSSTSFETKNSSALGLRFGASVVKMGPAELNFDATWRFDSKSDLNQNGAKIGQYQFGYLAAGAMVAWHAPLDLGIGMDFRAVQSELIEQSGGSEVKLGITHFSPWLRAQVGYTFPNPGVKPFVRLEYAMDLNAQDDYSIGGTNLDYNKAYGVAGPKKELSFQAGIRF